MGVPKIKRSWGELRGVVWGGTGSRDGYVSVARGSGVVALKDSTGLFCEKLPSVQPSIMPKSHGNM